MAKIDLAVYADAILPAPLTALSRRNRTAATPITTMTVKKSLNVDSESIPVVRTLDASVLFTAPSISASTIDPIPTMIARDTTARASGPRLSTPCICPFLDEKAFCFIVEMGPSAIVCAAVFCRSAP